MVAMYSSYAGVGVASPPTLVSCASPCWPPVACFCHNPRTLSRSKPRCRSMLRRHKCHSCNRRPARHEHHSGNRRRAARNRQRHSRERRAPGDEHRIRDKLLAGHRRHHDAKAGPHKKTACERHLRHRPCFPTATTGSSPPRYVATPGPSGSSTTAIVGATS